VADAMSAHGFSAHAERHGDELRIVSSHCPFGDVAIEHPVICAVDRGMVKGLLSSLYGETEVELSASMAMGDDSCVTDIHAG
jgi:predicted ArsR family transcriptional regulator